MSVKHVHLCYFSLFLLFDSSISDSLLIFLKRNYALTTVAHFIGNCATAQTYSPQTAFAKLHYGHEYKSTHNQASRSVYCRLLNFYSTNEFVIYLKGIKKGSHVLEVGPGPAGITRAAFEAGAKHVSVVEKDSRFLPGLQVNEAS